MRAHERTEERSLARRGVRAHDGPGFVGLDDERDILECWFLLAELVDGGLGYVDEVIGPHKQSRSSREKGLVKQKDVKRRAEESPRRRWVDDPSCAYDDMSASMYASRLARSRRSRVSAFVLALLHARKVWPRY